MERWKKRAHGGGSGSIQHNIMVVIATLCCCYIYLWIQTDAAAPQEYYVRTGSHFAHHSVDFSNPYPNAVASFHSREEVDQLVDPETTEQKHLDTNPVEAVIKKPVITGGMSPLEMKTILENMLEQKRADLQSATSSAGGTRTMLKGTSLVSADEFDITLVTVTTVDKLWMVWEIHSRWGGPLIVAVYVTSDEDETKVHESVHTTPLPNTRFVSRRSGRNPPSTFPINKLRNDALEVVTTSHFIVTDVDMWPNSQMYQRLHQGLPWSKKQDSKLALVIPSFAMKDKFCDTEKKVCERPVASTVPELQECSKAEQCSIYKEYVDTGTYSSTKYDMWWQEREGGSPRNIKCFESMGYEPFVLLRNSKLLPFYSERFHGFGGNRLQYIISLRYRGFNFAVVPRVFLIHFPHPPSAWKLQADKDSTSGSTIMTEFIGDLKEHFTPETHLCPGASAIGSPKTTSKGDTAAAAAAASAKTDDKEGGVKEKKKKKKRKKKKKKKDT